MSRIVAVGLAALTLAACQPAPGPAAPAETATPAVAADQAAQDAVWAALEEKYLGMEDAPADPIDALEWTEVHCNFAGGELGGDPEQDRAIHAWIFDTCMKQLDNARALRTTYANVPAALARIDAYIARHSS